MTTAQTDKAAAISRENDLGTPGNAAAVARLRTRRRSNLRWASASRADRIHATLLLIGVVTLVAIRLGPALVGGRVFLGMDLLNLYAPWSSSGGASLPRTSMFVSDQIDGYVPAVNEIAERFRQGDFASWTSLIGGGAPLLANPDFAIFTPGRWLYLFLPVSLAPGWSKLLELGFAATFAYLFVRRLSGSRIAAAVAGMVYPLTGFMISWTNWPQAAVGSAIPMLFWAIERFLQERRRTAAIPIALASALLVFGGFPAVAFQTFVVAAGYAMVRCISMHGRPTRQSLRDLSTAAVAVALGFGLTAFQLLPFAYRLIGGTDLSYRDGSFFSEVTPVYLLSSVFPQSFTGNDVHVQLGSPIDLNSYVGSAVLFLATLGLLAALTGVMQRDVGLYLAVVVAVVIGLVWFQGPWSNWMDHMPMLHGNPIGRIRSQLGVPAAVLGAAGIDVLRGRSWSGQATRSRLFDRSATPVVVAIVVTALVCAAGIAFATSRSITLPAPRWPDVLLAGVPLILICLLLAAGLRLRVARQAAIAVAIVAIAVQALAATAFYWPTADKSAYYPNSAALSYLQRNLGHDRIATMGYAVRPNATSMYGLRSITAHTFYPRPLKSLLEAVDPGAFRGRPTYALLHTVPDAWLNDDGLDRLGVRFLVSDANAAYPGSTDRPVPIPGDADPLPPSATSITLTARQRYSGTIAASPLRGVSIPLTVSTPTRVTATLMGSDGRVIATNSVLAQPGTSDVPVPLAAEPVGSSSSINQTTEYTIDVWVDRSGVVGSLDAGGRLRTQAVRSPQASDNARLAYAGEGLIVWERLGYVPRIRWASQAVVITDEAAQLAAAGRGVLNPDGVILARQPDESPPNGDGYPSLFEVVRDNGDQIAVDVTTSRAGYVVVADSIQTDFLAEVDGRRVSIEKADYAFGAVYVPAGKHRIELAYSPRGRTLGSAVSLVSIAVLLGAALPVAASLARRSRRMEPVDTSRDRLGRPLDLHHGNAAGRAPGQVPD